MNIKTNYDFPPIPIRNFDWSAWNDDTYDEDSIIGHGKTELDAINNLIEMIEGNVSAPINEVKEDKAAWRNASELIEIDYPLCIKLDGGGAPYYETIYSMDDLKKNVTDWCPIDKIMYLNEDNVEFKIKDAEKELKEKIKNLPQTYGEKGLGKVYDIAINDVLNLLKS